MTLYEEKLRTGAPVLRGAPDALAFACHCALLEAGFTPVDGAGEPMAELPADWNAAEPFVFLYRHARSALTFQVKAISFGAKLLLAGTAVEDPKQQIICLDLPLDKHVENGPRVVDSAGLSVLVRQRLADALVPSPAGQAPAPAAVSSSRPAPAALPPPLPHYRDPLRDYGSERGGGGYYPDMAPFAGGEGDLLPFGRIPVFGGGPMFGPGHFMGPNPGNLIGPGHPGFGFEGPPGMRPPFPAPRYDPPNPMGFPGLPNHDDIPHGARNMFM